MRRLDLLVMCTVAVLLAVPAAAAGPTPAGPEAHHPALLAPTDFPAHADPFLQLPQPLLRVWDDEVEREMTQAVPEVETGIGPGSALRIQRQGESGAFLCTANFVWTDDFDRLYLGTAGHCVLPDGKQATHGPDADYDANATSVEVRTGACPISGLGITCSLGGSSSPWVSLGAVTYGIYTGLGEDFAIIEIPEGLHDQVRHGLPVWGEPTDEATLGAQETVLHYGQGFVYGEAFLTRARAGIQQSLITASGSNHWSVAGASNPGDSGSGVVTGGNGGDMLEANKAIGILTHGAGIALPGVPEGIPLPVFLGTHVEHAKRLTGEHTGLRIWTLPGGSPLSDLKKPDPPRNGQLNHSLERGTVVVNHDHPDPTTETHTYQWTSDWDQVRLMLNLETQQGQAHVTIEDDTGRTLYSLSTDITQNEDTILSTTPETGWTITLEFRDHQGSLALRLEEAEESRNGGTGAGAQGDGSQQQEESEDEPPGAKPLPAPAGVLVLIALAAILVVLRRNKS